MWILLSLCCKEFQQLLQSYEKIYKEIRWRGQGEIPTSVISEINKENKKEKQRKVYKVTSYERVPRSSDRDLGNEGHTEGQPLKEIRKPGIYRAGDIHRNQLLSLAALTPQGPVYGKTAKHLCSLGTPVKAAHSDEWRTNVFKSGICH